MAAAGGIANCAALGGRATGARLQRMQKSPEWQGSHFENPQPIVNDNWAAVVTLFKPDRNVRPRSPPRTVQVEAERFAAPPPSGLRVTWLGHSTVLLEIDGHRFLTDPVWSERVGPTRGECPPVPGPATGPSHGGGRSTGAGARRGSLQRVVPGRPDPG